MTEDHKIAPLREWNRLTQENTENAIVASMYDALLTSSGPIDTFSTWLLVGAAAIASFFVGNVEKILPFITANGFKVCGGFLVLSCIFGLASKVYALRCKIGTETGLRAKDAFFEHIAKHNIEEQEIQKGAAFWGIAVETGVRMERVIEEFLKPTPFWVRWMTRRYLVKHQGNPQIGYILLLRLYTRQSVFGFLQVLAFLGFLISGFIYAKPI